MEIKRTVTVKKTEPKTLIIPDLRSKNLIPVSINIDEDTLNVSVSFGGSRIIRGRSYLKLEGRIHLQEYHRSYILSKGSDNLITLTNKGPTEVTTQIIINYESHPGLLVHEGLHSDHDIPNALDTMKGYRVVKIIVGSAVKDENLGGLIFKSLYPDLHEDMQYDTNDDKLTIEIPGELGTELSFFEIETLNPKVNSIHMLCFGYHE